MSADKIYYNGEIYACDHKENIYEAVAIKDGKILSAGANEQIKSLSNSGTIHINLEGKTVIPGFIDAHMHIFSLGFNLSNINCQMDSIEQVIKAVEEKAKEAENKDEWIIGWGFDESNYKEKRKLNKWDFESIENPVYITRYCLHEAVCNERVLKEAGITASTSIENGVVDRNEHGEATGLLIENAKIYAEKILPVRTKEKMLEAIKLANDYIVSRGITSIHDAGLGFFEDPFKEMEVLCESIQNKGLDVRMYVMVLAEYFSGFMNRYKEFSSERLSIGAMKLFADGTLSGRNAALSVPYKGTDEKGILLYTHSQLRVQMESAFKWNAPVAVHAIGDKAIAQVLDVYQALADIYPNRTARNRIEHAAIVNDTLLCRMKEANVTAVPQPYFLYTAGDNHMAVMGDNTGKYIALKSMIDNNLHPAGSSDAPVVDCNPLLGICAAMERKTNGGGSIHQEESISLKQAIRLYTTYAAYAAGEEHIKGSIEKGKFADMTVLPKRFMKYGVKEIKEAAIQMTIIHGDIVYKDLQE